MRSPAPTAILPSPHGGAGPHTGGAPNARPAGGARLVFEHELNDLVAEADQNGLLPVVVPAPAASERGRLALVIEEAIEIALERRGACAPGVGAASDLDASLSDQLYRARLLELRGLMLHLGPLEATTNLGGALDAEDSAVLRFWLDAPATRPVELCVDARNAYLGVYGPPLALRDWLHGANPPRAEALETIPCVAPEVAASAACMELSEPPPLVHVEERAADSADSADADGPDSADAADEPISPTPQTELAGDLAAALVAQLTETSDSRVPPPLELEGLDELNENENEAEDEGETPITTTVEALEEPIAAVATAPAASERPAQVETLGPLHADAIDQWPHWLKELEEARGPRPLAAVERMFVTSYVPLRDAYLRGIAPGEVGVALDAWSQSFAKSYKDAFAALKVRGKRPTMVLDVPDVALRIGRLHGARSVQLLLVDGLRFDLGLRVEQVLRRRFGQEAALTERLLLWSALPTETPTQLELIGRGPDGLKQLGSAPESEVPVARGRMASTPRRIKAGHRELLKLDLVEARLSEAGEPEAERLDALAVDVASSIEELASKLPNRTLLMVFGDHGFLFDDLEGGTGRARSGGSSPEEVLVPAFAWLVGGLH
jgi:hypothetical protein